MKDETYDYCNAEECPYMANGNLEDHVIELDEIPDYSQELSLAYDNYCNYKCTCCVARKNDPFDPEVEKKIEQEIRVALPHIKCCTGNGQGVEIEYIYDRNSKLAEWQGYEVRKPQNHSLTATDSPILVTLIARHGEMEEFLRKHEYAGDILCLDKILETFRYCK